MEQKFYIERIEGGKHNFNLWEKEGNRFFNIATLYYGDAVGGNQWTVDDKSKSVSYDEDELKDEIESPLRQIPAEKAQKLLKLTSPKEVADSLDALLE